MADPVRLTPVLARAEVLRRDGEARDAAFREDRAELRQIERSLDEQRRRSAQATAEADRIAADWQGAIIDAGLDLAIATADARLALFEELRADLDAIALPDTRINGIDADIGRFEADLTALAADVGETAEGDAGVILAALRARLDTTREAQRRLADLATQRERLQRDIDAASAAHTVAIQSLAPAYDDAGLVAGDNLAAAVEDSRALRRLREEPAEIERQVTSAGDGLALLDLVADWDAANPDNVEHRAMALVGELADLSSQVTAAATIIGETRLAFAAVEGEPAAAADAAPCKRIILDVDVGPISRTPSRP
ncbi:hypothetical protein [Sphingomonas solaris]|uniref:Uncharacterized protein n=1 Tax=Alterirhizorhabdus solaris TaxID=2529389 RepID=A0A558R4Z4_9SPHN|nr:hypothetical protein [Sphingomonas solaris]TVV74446.1 hypothetical protein FOY91_09705 [Sphingomonas solaris]